MDYNCFKQYFISYAYQPGNSIQSFIMSDDDRVLSNARSNSAYPQLQLDRPNYQAAVVKGGAHAKTYTSTVYILQNCEKDDYTGQETAMNDLEALMDGLIAYLDYLRKAKDFRVTQIGSAFPIRMHEMNNLWGWGLQFTMEARSEFCHDDTADVDVQEITPVWVAGETSLGITIDGSGFTATWSEEHLLNRALESLMTDINNAVNNISAKVLHSSLILIHNTAGNTMTISDISGGHQWEINNC